MTSIYPKCPQGKLLELTEPTDFDPLQDIATDGKEKMKTKQVKKFAWLPVLIDNKWYWSTYYLCTYVAKPYTNKWKLKRKELIES